MSDTQSDTLVQPVGERERIGEVDVLRGLALFGVLAMNFTAFANSGVMATDAQMAALSTAGLDYWAYEFVRVFIGDKANTVFATLFGLGFYIQLSRSDGKPGFEGRYARRLFWLLVFGLINTLFLWIWDILHLYAIAGFGLLLMRRWSMRALVVTGLGLALYSDHLQGALFSWLHVPIAPDPALATDQAILAKQALVASGDYPAIVANFAHWTWSDWISGGIMMAWIIYALGRFALGAAIGRSGLFDNVARHIPLLRRIAWVGIPLGVAISVVIRIALHRVSDMPGDHETLIESIKALRSPTALILSAGYCAGVLVALQSGWGQRLFSRFGAVGRMALTNYLLQGFIYAFILFGVGPGLGLAGQIGTTAIVAICIAFFSLQIMFSHWWLARFRFGPMEYLWRWLTYGMRPSMRRSAPLAA
ncbi:DUF418 domain-containing protein [Sphingomonas sp.]|uniref:DUF418 domain-containing protein n=1 Tax=Sphingomonas sp. TaxID=28214 RepID=UPI00286B2786|nr:DUF418 domain-containing protein [Sphingomonas sp.]